LISFLSTFLSNVYLWLLVLVAIFVCWATAGHRNKRWAGMGLVAVLWVAGTKPGADLLTRPLEREYSPPSIDSLKEQGVCQVVVLTGGGYSVSGESFTSAFPHASTYRFLGGLELCSRIGPECRIIFSGSAGRRSRDRATADTMKELALTLEPNREVIAESRSGATEEHPINVGPLVGDKPFVLVTSATHMPRAMRTFRRAGLNPIAYPVDYLSTGHYSWSDVMPSAGNLWDLGAALREYEALLFYSVRNK
jgi:uncharacterized SAM-binding protein YcdF (DUF218 family)